jgi:hypothetical protein
LPSGVTCKSARDIYLNRHSIKHKSDLSKAKTLTSELKNTKDNNEAQKIQTKSLSKETSSTTSLKELSSVHYKNLNDDPFSHSGITIKRKPSDIAIVVFGVYTDDENIVHDRPVLYVDIGNNYWEKGEYKVRNAIVDNDQSEVVPYKVKNN